jgi:aspartate aminotransferase-like enzyme
VRELMLGDPNAERQRMLEKLHMDMLQETDPEVRRAYSESIAALQRHESTDAKAT